MPTRIEGTLDLSRLDEPSLIREMYPQRGPSVLPRTVKSALERFEVYLEDTRRDGTAPISFSLDAMRGRKMLDLLAKHGATGYLKEVDSLSRTNALLALQGGVVVRCFAKQYFAGDPREGEPVATVTRGDIRALLGYITGEDGQDVAEVIGRLTTLL